MGASPYWYYVAYRPEIDLALNELRNREFNAGRYNPVIPFPEFPITEESPSPGAGHKSIEEALSASKEDGTRSILDIDHISEEMKYCAAAPLGEDTIEELYGTNKPTHTMVEEDMSFFDYVDRLMAIYIILYEDDMPSEILFAGYSAD